MARPKLPPDASPLILRLRLMLLIGAAPAVAFLAVQGAAVRVGTLVATVALFALVGPRVRFGFGDRPHAPWLVHGVVPAFDAWWTGVQMLPPLVVLGLPLYFAFGLRTAGWTVLALGALAGLYGVTVGRHAVRTRRVEVAVEGLAEALDGYRIVHLSDLHIGSWTTAAAAQRWVARSNALSPDLVAITGDFLTSGADFHAEVVRGLSGLVARDGVFACLGNHDYYEEDALVTGLSGVGIRVLRNEGVALREGLFVAGIEDMWKGRPDLPAALEQREGATTVLLAHHPEEFPHASRHEVDLTLSGHTHAGQVAVPWLVKASNLAHLTTRYPFGLYRDGAHHLHVSAGLGTTGPMFRLGAAPEVVEIVLRRR
ncbi:MAG: metallophosphoesterase [Myxococcales bacterium]|nr:metallophosphoesterase [Myxococcales bacterium]